MCLKNPANLSTTSYVRILSSLRIIGPGPSYSSMMTIKTKNGKSWSVRIIMSKSLAMRMGCKITSKSYRRYEMKNHRELYREEYREFYGEYPTILEIIEACEF